MANLTQLRMLEELNGFLLVDKPVGIAFSTVLKAVKRKFNLVKVGHGGSLDAMASGLFVLLINDANRFVNDVMGADRDYEGTMRLGLRTNTHDIHGVPLATSSVPTELPNLVERLAECRGDIFQTEPRYSSIRKEGSADYEIADTGEHAQFLTHVYRFSVKEPDGAKLPFAVSGTKNLLVRTLVNDFGELLGCGAALESLRRIRVGRFSVADAIPFETLLKMEMGGFGSCVLPLRLNPLTL